MFETLSDKLSGSLRKVRGRGRLTEDNVSQTLNEVKMALLEADVNFRVVKAFLRSVKVRAVGEEVDAFVGPPGRRFHTNAEFRHVFHGQESTLLLDPTDDLFAHIPCVEEVMGRLEGVFSALALEACSEVYSS